MADKEILSEEVEHVIFLCQSGLNLEDLKRIFNLSDKELEQIIKYVKK